MIDEALQSAMATLRPSDPSMAEVADPNDIAGYLST